MTKIEFAQMAANLTVAAVTRKYTRDYLQTNTNSPEILTEIVSGMAAGTVAEKTRPLTDDLVSKAAVKLSTLRKK